jgi:dipeptidyl aminopeptidase/acylaminoacyl peptidase
VEPGVHTCPRFTPNGDKIIFAFEDPRHPADLWALSPRDGSTQQLTHSLSAQLQDSHFVMPSEIRYPSLDSVEVPALLFQPEHADKNPPGVVVVHGGPNWLYQFSWMPLVQHMASRGWVVLAPNYRGSTGYGRAWQLASRFDLGGVDTADVVAGADYLANQGLADRARIAVTGRSHGGYLTMTSLTQYPDRWAAGSAIVPFLNWFTAHANSREDLQHWDIENMGDPQEKHDLWQDRSPYFFLDRIQAPVQLVCGAHDPRCPVSESIRAREALLELGKEIDFTLYEDEGHSFLKIENVIDAEIHRVSFLAKVLEKTGNGDP